MRQVAFWAIIGLSLYLVATSAGYASGDDPAPAAGGMQAALFPPNAPLTSYLPETFGAPRWPQSPLACPPLAPDATTGSGCSSGAAGQVPVPSLHSAASAPLPAWDSGGLMNLAGVVYAFNCHHSIPGVRLDSPVCACFY